MPLRAHTLCMAKGLDPDRPKHYQLVMIKGVGSGQVVVHKVERGKVMEAQNMYVHLSDVWQMKASAQRRALKKIRGAAPPPDAPNAPTPEPTPAPEPVATESVDVNFWFYKDAPGSKEWVWMDSSYASVLEKLEPLKNKTIDKARYAFGLITYETVRLDAAALVEHMMEATDALGLLPPTFDWAKYGYLLQHNMDHSDLFIYIRYELSPRAPEARPPTPVSAPEPDTRTMTCYSDAEIWWMKDGWTKYMVEADAHECVSARPCGRDDFVELPDSCYPFYYLTTKLFRKECWMHEIPIILTAGSILDFDGDAIVNAANTRCLGGGGIDGAINARGGEALVKAREELPLLDEFGTRCEVGDAKVTIAGDLKCKYVIHAVGPDFGRVSGYDGSFGGFAAKLVSAYRQAMIAAKEHKMKKIAFCIISGGIYRGSYPLWVMCEIAFKTIAAYLYDGLEEVYFYTYTEYEKKEVSESARSLSTRFSADYWQTRLSF